MIRRLVVCAPARADARRVRAEFPEVEVMTILERFPGRADGPVFRMRSRDWEVGEPDFFELDRSLGDAGGSRPATLVLDGSGDLTRVATALLTRLQWAIEPPSRLAEPRMAAVRSRHREIHDLRLALVHADWLHGLDTQAWTLRLDPEADDAVLAAALFHDVERLLSEAHERVEHQAHDYDAFKRAHALRGARIVREVLAGVLESEVLERVAALVADHELPGGDGALALLVDADALSFFSRNAPGFLVWYGAAHTRMKVGWTLSRMSSRARARLRDVKLPRAIAAMVSDISGGMPVEGVFHP